MNLNPGFLSLRPYNEELRYERDVLLDKGRAQSLSGEEARTLQALELELEERGVSNEIFSLISPTSHAADDRAGRHRRRRRRQLTTKSGSPRALKAFGVSTQS